MQLIIRGPRGMELTPAGRVFLDHARVILAQVETAIDAARRVARPAKTSFIVGFLTGHEIGWLPRVLEILREDLRENRAHHPQRLIAGADTGAVHGADGCRVPAAGQEGAGLEFRLVARRICLRCCRPAIA